MSRHHILLPLLLGCLPPKTEFVPVHDDDTGGDATDADADADTDADTDTDTVADADGDGSPGDVDCDDADATVYPGAPERCDGADDDCDGRDDTLGYWPFDEGSGAVATDAGPLGIDGTVVNATWTTGHAGGALEFDGHTAYVELDFAELAPEQGLTISAWVRPESLAEDNWDTVVSRGSNGTSDLGCCADSYFLGYESGAMSFYGTTATASGGLVDPGQYQDHIGSWHHVLATWDATTGARAVYVDGVQTASDLLAPGEPLYDGTPTLIGGDLNSAELKVPFHGGIDEVKIFGCAVDEGQAAVDYGTGWPF